jgi:hypothetical protein
LAIGVHRSSTVPQVPHEKSNVAKVVLLQVARHSEQSINAVVCGPEGHIALGAKKGSHNSRFMVVIDGQALDHATVTNGRLGP